MDRAVENRNEMQDPRVDQLGGDDEPLDKERAPGKDGAGKEQTKKEGWGTEGLGADDGMGDPDHQGGDPSKSGDHQLD